ncbi:MAG: peptidylprolyl isomerase [Aquificae bacterium]|nr:peptidylprolyl isomerase [Aquificota bacterium]
MVKYLLTVVLLFITATTTLAQQKEGEYQLYDKIAIVVNGQPILKSEVDLAKQWFGIKDTKKAVQRLIDQILMAQEAQRAGIRVSPKEIDEALERLARANGYPSLKTFKEKLQRENLSYTELRDLVKRELLIQKYTQVYLPKVLFGGIKEGQEIQTRKVYVIYLSKEKEDFEKKYKYLKENLKPENFTKLAKEYSDDPITAEKGGLIGDVKKGDLIKALDKAIWEHKVGDIFEVPVENGVYFVYIQSEEKKVEDKPLKREEIAKRLKQEYELRLNKLRQQATIEYLDPTLKP